MRILLNIILYLVIWFIAMALLFGFWMVGLGNDPVEDRFPFLLSIISLLIPYYIVYKLKLIDKIKNIFN